MTAERLLFVDDDRLVLATLAKGLKEAGYRVHTAESATEALAVCANTAFDLAILDIGLPVMTGIELASRLREEHGLAVMFLSANGDRDQVAHAVAEGGVGFLIKPAGIGNLIPEIECALARARDLQALTQLKAQLEAALSSGRATSMAIGLMMERYRLSEQQAFARLREAARSRREKLEFYCADLVASAERSWHG